MEYSFKLSQSSLDILANVSNPDKKDIEKQRGENASMVGTTFYRIRKDTGLSLRQIRRLLQSGLYGPLGVLYRTFEGIHSPEEIASLSDPNRIEKEIVAYKNMEDNEGLAYLPDGTAVKVKNKESFVQEGLYIPEQIQREVGFAIDSEERVFSGSFERKSCPVLEFILNRSLKLRKKHGENWYPFFSDKSISRDSTIGLDEVRRATVDLTGILCESYKMIYHRKWGKILFLPSSRFSLVKELVS